MFSVNNFPHLLLSWINVDWKCCEQYKFCVVKFSGSLSEILSFLSTNEPLKESFVPGTSELLSTFSVVRSPYPISILFSLVKRLPLARSWSNCYCYCYFRCYCYCRCQTNVALPWKTTAKSIVMYILWNNWYLRGLFFKYGLKTDFHLSNAGRAPTNWANFQTDLKNSVEMTAVAIFIYNLWSNMKLKWLPLRYTSPYS